MNEGYKTLSQVGEDSFIIKKSRFIGTGSPVHSEEEALDFLSSVKNRYRDARHHCWAYILGKNKGIMRYSDDGEPGGTAGLPIIEVMKNLDVTDCIVVVTRYFGGILLGAGGLTRAYAKGSKTALNAAKIISMEPSVRFWAEVDYSLWGRVEYYLQSAPVRREGADFAATVTATLLVRKEDQEAVYADLVRITDGRVELMEVEEMCVGWETLQAQDEEIDEEDEE